MPVVTADEALVIQDTGVRVGRPIVISGLDSGNYKSLVGLNSSGKVDPSLVAGGAGIGDMVSTNNLSDVANAATSRTNLGINLALYVTKAGALMTPPAANVPAAIGDVTFELTSDTELTVSAKGSDGVVRKIILPLA